MPEPMFVISTETHFKDNPPINLALCVSFEKKVTRIPPNSKQVPSITFYFTGSHCSWKYQTEEERDEAYDSLVYLLTRD